MPVWNNRNQYGSGIRDNSGLTEKGKTFLKKAIDLGIMIDVSHANKKTFFDIMDLVEQEQLLGKEVYVIASHSNARNLCDMKRNLTDEQLLRLKEVGGYIGLLLHGGFLTKNNEKITMGERKPYFLKHLDYITKNINFPEDKILISTDNMNFNPDPTYHNLEAFKIESVNNDLRRYLSKTYSEDFIDKIMKNNAKNLFNNVKEYNRNNLSQNRHR